MLLTQSIHTKILLIALTVFMAVPCTVKKELKQWLKIETNQQLNSENSRIACYSFVQQEKQNTKQLAEKVILRNTSSDFKNRSASIENKIQLPDFYTSKKEEIPSYILFERFLI